MTRVIRVMPAGLQAQPDPSFQAAVAARGETSNKWLHYGNAGKCEERDGTGTLFQHRCAEAAQQTGPRRSADRLLPPDGSSSFCSAIVLTEP